jgi:endonuclease-3
LSINVKRKRAIRIIKILEQATKKMPEPASVTIVKKYGRDPYLVLISCLLSLRAKDTASLPVSIELFKHGKTPDQIIKLPLEKIEKIIYSVGYFHSKAKQIKEVSQTIIDRFNGVVPDSYEDLIAIKGVGPKTANLVLATAFGKPALIVDIHVHRISNRLGLIKTKTPEETQIALEQLLPEEYWNTYSRLLVVWGQNICLPVSPLCSQCPIYNECVRVCVTWHR